MFWLDTFDNSEALATFFGIAAEIARDLQHSEDETPVHSSIAAQPPKTATMKRSKAALDLRPIEARTPEHKLTLVPLTEKQHPKSFEMPMLELPATGSQTKRDTVVIPIRPKTPAPGAETNGETEKSAPSVAIPQTFFQFLKSENEKPPSINWLPCRII
jgi:hypothetical protein